MIRILSCNILLDLEEHVGKPIEWDAGRRAVCERVIKSRNADIIALQEIGPKQIGHFVESFPDYLAVGYTDPHIDTQPPGFQGIKNVTLIRRDRFEMESQGIYWLSDTPHLVSRFGEAKLPRHVTWVRLRDKQGGKVFRALNTHWALQQPVRLKAAQVIASESSQYQGEFPQLLAGDFNSTFDSEEHKVLREAGWRDTYEAVHGTTNPGHTGHAYQGPNREPKRPPIDLVFFRGNVKPVGAEIIRDAEGEIYPSDHYFVAADVEI